MADNGYPVMTEQERASLTGETPAPHVTALQLAGLAMAAFAERSLRFLSMALTFVLCGAVTVRPHWLTLVAAGVFAALVSPLWWRRERRE